MGIRTCLRFSGISLILLFAHPALKAQTLLNTTGSTLQSGQYVFEYSVGEISITALQGTSRMVTQGLLQPNVKVINPGCDYINQEFSYFPNPVQTTVSLVGVYNWIDSYVMFAADGKLVAHAPFINNTIDMSRFASGVYFVQLFPGCNGNYKTLKILKQ